MKRCEHCGTANVATQTRCTNCGQPFDMRGAPAAHPVELPSWLLDAEDAPSAAVGAGPQGATAAPLVVAPPAGVHAAPVDDADLPAWLRDLQTDGADDALPVPQASSLAPQPGGNGQASEDANLPSWLLAEDPTNDDLPDWLRSDRPASTGAAPPVSVAEATPTTEDSLPTWLLEAEAPVAVDNPAPPPALDIPSWLQDAPAPNTAVSAAHAKVDDVELPDWLREADAAPVPVAATPMPAAELPAWLQEVDTPPVPTAAVAAELPDWLQEVDTPATPSPAFVAEDVPAWLQDVDPPPAPPSAPAATAPMDLPAWLTDDAPPVRAEVPASTAPAPSAPPPDTALPLPDWLNDFGIETPEDDVSAAVPAESQAPSNVGDQLPAWLRDDAPPVAEAPSSALPDWLQDDTPPAMEAPSSALPDWLRDDPPAATETASSAMPNWLQDDAPAATQTPSSALPDWLREDTAAANTMQGDDDLPSWLQTDAPTVVAASQVEPTEPTWAAAPTPPAAAQVELPAWLQDVTPPVAEVPAPATVTAAPPASAQVELPSWLQDTAPEPDQGAQIYNVPPAAADDDGARVYEAPTPPQQAASGPQQSSIPDGTLPSWLQDWEEPAQASATPTLPTWLEGEPSARPQPLAAQSTAKSPLPSTTSSDELLSGLDLPAWLRDTPDPATDVPEPPVAVAPTPVLPSVPTYLEAGLGETDVVPVAPVVVAPVRRTIERSPQRLEAVQLLGRIRTEPIPEPVRTAPLVRRGRLAIILQIIAAVLIIAAILAALLGPRLPLSFGFAATPVALPSAAQQIGSLEPGRPVLLAYEWDARRAAELGPLSSAVVGRLRTRQVPLLFMSTDPQGSLLTEQATNELAQSNDPLYAQRGQGYLNLGYKAGGAFALANLSQQFGAAFAQDARGQDLRRDASVINAMCGVTSGAASDCALTRLGMIVVLADEQSDVQSWVEQVHSTAPAVPMLFVTPTEVGPQVRPFLTRPSLTALVGMPDVLALVGGAPNERLSRQADAQSLGAAAFGLLVLLGAGPAAWAGRRARRRGERSAWDH